MPKYAARVFDPADLEALFEAQPDPVAERLRELFSAVCRAEMSPLCPEAAK